MSERAPTLTPRPGLRVIRGPDWRWGDQDGGEGGVGTVIHIGGGPAAAAEGEAAGSAGDPTASPEGTVVLQWDGGNRTNYRIGHKGAYDLRVVDSGPAGTRHSGIPCSGGCEPSSSSCSDIVGMRWSCAHCFPSVNLCSKCYMADEHDTTHKFRRFDSGAEEDPGQVVLPPRAGARKIQLRGAFKGATVVRSSVDWKWEEQDGGKGSPGTVLDIQGGQEGETARSIAQVRWAANGITNFYRLGHKGKVDVKLQPGIPTGRGTSGGGCYPDHLPVLAHVPEEAAPAAGTIRGIPSLPPSSPAKKKQFKVGDSVKMTVANLETLQKWQEGHGGFNPKMADLMGREGRVHRITDNGDVRVQFPGKPEQQFRWTVNPAALTKVPSFFREGDIVLVCDDESEVREKQRGHGEWTDTLRMALGKRAKVTKVYKDGDVIVTISGQSWTLNPDLLSAVSQVQEQKQHQGIAGAAAAASPSRSDGLNMSASGQPSLFVSECAMGREDAVRRALQSTHPVDVKLLAKGLQAAAQQGKISVVRTLIGYNARLVESRCKGKTPLMVAAHQGHLEIADLLLSSGAAVDAADDEGDQSVHYAVIGRQPPSVLQFLLERGASANAANRKGCAPLAVAAILGEEECARVLIENGADVNHQDSDGDTALHEAVAKRNEAMVDVLCAADGVDLADCRNDRGFGAVHFAAFKGNSRAVDAMIRADPRVMDIAKEDGFTPLHLASLNGSVEVVRVLMGKGCKVDARDNSGQTPLHLAAAQGFFKVLELLLHNDASSAGVNVNIRDAKGNTPLHVALSREGEPDTSGLKCDPAALEVNEAIAAKVRKAGVRAELRRWVAIGVLLIINGADLMVMNRQRMSCYDRIQDPASRAILQEEFISRDEGAKEDDAASSRKSETAGNSNSSPAPAASSSSIECRVCSQQTEAPVVFLPCKHRITCGECAPRIKKCLECRAEIKEKVQEKPSDKTASAPATSSDPELAKKLNEWEEQFCCPICMERKKDVVFPCGHATCSECVETIKVCHMCRGPIDKQIHLF